MKIKSKNERDYLNSILANLIVDAEIAAEKDAAERNKRDDKYPYMVGHITYAIDYLLREINGFGWDEKALDALKLKYSSPYNHPREIRGLL